MQKDDDQLIKKMAKLLREGATMLDKSCPECGALIYRLPNKKIICPSCNKEIIIQKGPIREKEPLTQYSHSLSNPRNFSSLLSTLDTKLEFLNQKLHSETDYSQIEKITSIMENLLKIYEKIYRIIGTNNADT